MEIENTPLLDLTSSQTLIYGEGGRMLVKIDADGVVTFAEDLTLGDAKQALRIALENIVKGMK